jgi:hypothetical protein
LGSDKIQSKTHDGVIDSIFWDLQK